MKKPIRNKGITVKLLPVVLLLAAFFLVGCKSTSTGAFSMPSFKSGKSAPQKPKKDPGTPDSVEEWLAQPRSGF